MRLHIYLGPALSGKTERIIEEMEQIHHESPLSYTFLGPSGGFVKESADWFARRLCSAIPRGNFLVIDQFAVELYRFMHQEKIHADEHLQKVFIAEIVSSMGPEELGSFHPLKDSPALVRFVAEAVKDARNSGERDLMVRLANDESRSLVQMVLKELKDRYGARTFDTFDAYQEIDPEDSRGHIRSRFGSRLFIDGFLNFSWSHMIFLSKIIPQFDEAFVTLDTVVLEPECWSEFREMLRSASIEIVEEHLHPSGEITAFLGAILRDENQPTSLRKDFIKLARYKDPEEELVQVCREIKRRIVDEGMEPGEIAVVLNNFSERGREFSRKLEEYGVPVRMSGDEPLSSSVAVQLLVLPFKTARAGYPPQMLISMLDHGLGLSEPAEFDLDSLEGLAAGAGLYMGPMKSSLKERRVDWSGKLEEHLSALRSRLDALSQEEDVYDSELQAQEEAIQLCKEVQERAEEIFQSLERIEAARISPVDLDLYLEELALWMAPLKRRVLDNPELENEALAIEKVEYLLGRMEAILGTMGKRRLTLDQFMTFSGLLLNSEEYKPSPAMANVVEVISLTSARFRHRSLKFIVNFNDGIFPVRRSNPLYPLAGFIPGSSNYYQEKAREQKEDLYACLSTSSEAIITYPEASREGEPLLPSLWLDGWRGIEDRSTRDGPSLPMSSRELKVEYGFSIARGTEPLVPEEAQDLVEPVKLLAGAGFSWRIEDRKIVESLLGKIFSYTKLSEFKRCPFKFFLRRILRLEERPDDRYGLSSMEQGFVYHAALKSLYEWGQEEGKTLELAGDVGKIRDVAEGIMQRFFAANRVRSLPAVRRSMIDEVVLILQSYLNFEMQDTVKACIGDRILTELPFSLQLREMGHLLSGCAERYGDLILQGRIDRIDLNMADRKQTYDLVLSDYKSSSSSAEWDQLKLYSLVLLALNNEGIPRDPGLIRAFFRIVKEPGISRKMDAFPAEARMDLQTRPKSSLSFQDVDRDLLGTLDRIFEERTFSLGRAIDESASNCYLCSFKRECDGLADRAKETA